MQGCIFTIFSVDNLRNLYEKRGLAIDKGKFTVYITMDERSEK